MTIAPERLATLLADRYRIERPLGAGGMATVYLAKDLKHDRDVALKVLRPELGAVLGPERFLAEIKITARLDHPHILTLIDSGAADGFLYYVLPLVRGESLRQKLEREKQLGLDEALAITTQVANALDYAHRQGVVHRDIKPENILLQEGEAVLTDFGIALAVKEAGGNRLTETGLSLGTPQYMSPEQATGDRALDARSDIYSLAAVLYELLAGEPPVTGPNAQAMIAKLMTERPVRLRVVRDTVPDAVDAAVAKALSKVPADRFTTAGSFARSLVAAAAATPARVSAPSRWLMVAGAGIAAVVLGTAAAMNLRGRPAPVTSFTPRFEQLTTDGNARSGVLSPDGTRLAYVARDCDERERCTERLVVRDIGSAASITVLEAGVIPGAPVWAADGRFMVAGIVDPGAGLGAVRFVVVSALGGTPRSLPGYGGGVIGTTDTVLVTSIYTPGTDSVAWLRAVTVSDGLVRDSIPIRQPNNFQVAYPAPRGGSIALLAFAMDGTSLRLLDRAGRITDSLPTFPSTLRPAVRWAPQGDAIVLQVDLREGNLPFVSSGFAAAPTALVRYRVSASGRFTGPADTLMTLERGSGLTQLRPDGSALLSRQPMEAVVYALERSAPGRVDFRSRRLSASTAGLSAGISRDGATVLLKHGGSSPGSSEQYTFVSFDGGPERPFTLPPGAEIITDWTRPVSSTLLYAFRDSSGRSRLAEVDVATGRSRRVTNLPSRTSFIFAIPGGGYGAADIEAGSASIIGRPGKPDTTWSVPPTPGREFTIPGDATIDGRAFLAFSQLGDSIWMRRIPLDGSASSATMSIRNDQWFGVMPDGSLETIRTDSTRRVAWYRLAPGSDRVVRLGDAPTQGTRAPSPFNGVAWGNSEDGRRFVVVKSADRPDIYLLRNFGERLSR